MSSLTHQQTPTNRRLPVIAGIVVLLVACCAFSMSSTGDALVVYCAHDSIYSEQLLREFEEASGIEVAIRFDTEATKSLGLVNLLLKEREHPRCDVFWNNELLGMLDLHEAGVLHRYRGPGYERIPDRYKDPDGYWAGFGGRMRVWIVNQSQVPLEPNGESNSTVEDLEERLSSDASQMVFANPFVRDDAHALYDALAFMGRNQTEPMASRV